MQYLALTEDIPYNLKKRYLSSVPSSADEATKSWDNFKSKKDIEWALFYRQYGLCAYCENKLEQFGQHIEHVQPKSTFYEKTFEYSNLILSCFHSDALRDIDRQQYSCGHFKRSWYDATQFISPTDTDCGNYFTYSMTGQIIAKSTLSDEQRQKAQYTIEKLNLNCRRLVRERQQLMQEGFNIIKKLGDDLSFFIDCELGKTDGKLNSYINHRIQCFKYFAPNVYADYIA